MGRRGVVAAGVLIYVAGTIVVWHRANRRLANYEFNVQATPEKLRTEAHWVLSGPAFISNYHNACIVLIEHGNADSIPVLRRALLSTPEPSPEGLVVCTWGHCVQALEKLTATR